jgi:hypothetical protein
MSINYEVQEDGTITYRKDDTLVSIPPNPGNSDYQRYLRWLENPDAEENGTIS